MFLLFTRGTEIMDMSRTSKSEIVATCAMTQVKPMTDQLIVAKTLLADWREGQFEQQGDCETEWSDEEDGDVSEMSPDNRVLWQSFLNKSDHNIPFHFSTKVTTPENEREEVKGAESFLSIQGENVLQFNKEDDSDWSEEEVSEMSSDNRDLWEYFLKNSDPYNLLHVSCSTKTKTSDTVPIDEEEEEEEEEATSLVSHKNNTVKSAEAENEKHLQGKNLNSDHLHFSCPAKVKLKTSQTPAPLRHTAYDFGQSTKKPAKKVRFSKQVTIHTLQAWSVESRAARDGSCWMEMARDRNRFQRRVNQTEEMISTCLTAQHRAKVLAGLLERSERSTLVTACQKKLFSVILAAVFLKIFLCTAVVFTSIR